MQCSCFGCEYMHVYLGYLKLHNIDHKLHIQCICFGCEDMHVYLGSLNLQKCINCIDKNNHYVV